MSENQQVQEPIDGEYLSGKEMLDLERERIKSADRRTEIARLAIEANDAADQRMFDYHMSRLERETALKTEQIKIAKTFIYGGGIIGVLSVALLVIMSFYGDAHQSHLAAVLFEKLLDALGGIGSYLIVKGSINKLTKPPTE